jgi:hypothetical protein
MPCTSWHAMPSCHTHRGMPYHHDMPDLFQILWQHLTKASAIHIMPYLFNILWQHSTRTLAIYIMPCLYKIAWQLSTRTSAMSTKSASSHIKGILTSQARANIFAVWGRGCSVGANFQLMKFRALLLCPKFSTGSPCTEHSCRNSSIIKGVNFSSRLN